MGSRYLVVLFCLGVLFFHAGWGLCFEPAAPLTDREIIERLSRLEEGQKSLRDEMKVRFESMDRRFDSMDKRFESIEKRFDQLIGLLMGIIGAFAAIVAVTIGFAIWDRRTAVRPLEAQIKLLESEKVNRMRAAMRAYGEKNHELATVLRNFGLM